MTNLSKPKELKLTGLHFFYVFLFYSLINLLLFFKSLANYFLSDDFLLLDYASKNGISGLFISDVHYFRPVRMIIYKMLYAFSGSNPVPYMIFNLLLHVLTCYLVFLLSMRFFSLFGKYRERTAIFLLSFLTGLLFSVLYIHSEAVVNISSTSELLYTFFYLICLNLYFQYRDHGKKSTYALMCALFVAALFTKETAISLVPCILFIEMYFFREVLSDFLYRHYPLILLACVFLLSRYLITPQMVLTYTETSAKMAAMEIIKNIMLAYVALFFSLNFIHIKNVYKANYLDFSQLLSSILNEIPYIILIILFVIGFYFWACRKRDKLINFCTLFILISILPFVWLVGYERYLYLPSFGFAMLIIYLFFPIDTVHYAAWKKYLSLAVLLFIFIYNIHSLTQKNENWNIAAAESKKIVMQMEKISSDFPPGSEVYFKNLPDNYKGAWIFRQGISYIPSLILKRNDLTFYGYYDSVRTEPEKKIFCYDYLGGNLLIIR